MILSGQISLNNAGKFNILINENKEIFKKYFGVYLFPGSINIMVEELVNLSELLDTQALVPDFIIPKEELKGMPSYIGNGQAWKVQLKGECWGDVSMVDAWIFRRVGSRTRKGTIEIVSDSELNKPYNLKDKDKVLIKI